MPEIFIRHSFIQLFSCLILCLSLQLNALQAPNAKIESTSEVYFNALGTPLKQTTAVATTAVFSVLLTKVAEAVTGCERTLNNNDEITLDYSLVNQGFMPVESKFIRLDNLSVDASLIELTLPEGITFNRQKNTQTPFGQWIVLPKNEAGWQKVTSWQGQSPLQKVALMLNAPFSAKAQVDVTFPLVVSDANVLVRDLVFLLEVDANADGSANFQLSASCINDNPAPSPDITVHFEQIQPNLTGPFAYNDESIFSTASPYILDEEPVYQLPQSAVFIRAVIPTANQDPNQKERVIAEVSSTKTSASLSLRLLETAVNSGVFRSEAALSLSSEKTTGETCLQRETEPLLTSEAIEGCLLQAALADGLTVTIIDPETNLPVRDQGQTVADYTVKQHLTGRVFDSILGKAVADLTVTVFDLATENIVSTVQTDDNGVYLFDQLPEGTYALSIENAAQYQFPSTVPENLLADSIDEASYGLDGYLGRSPDSGIIMLKATGFPLTVNLPVDQKATNRLVVTKTVNQPEAELGDRVRYEVTVKNRLPQTAVDVALVDQLPFGFKLEPDSLKLAGEPIKPIQTDDGFQINLGDLVYEQEKQLTYVVKLTAGALDSNGINHAYAFNSTTKSNTAKAKVKVVQQGLLSDKAIIFGKLFIDDQCQMNETAEKWPVAGVRLYLENGAFVVTDENGQYSFYGIDPGLHVLKLDSSTLPLGIKPYAFEQAFAYDAESRFIDLMPGDFHQANFAFNCPEGAKRKALYEALRKRNQSINGDWLLEDAVQFKGSLSSTSNRQLQSNTTDGDLGKGLLTQQGAEQVVKEEKTVLSSKQTMPSAKAIATEISREAARKGQWLWPLGEESYDGKVMYVTRLGINPILYLNGEPVSASLLGENAQHDQNQLQVHAWYRLPFISGENKLVVKGLDPFGNERTLVAERVVFQPDAPQKLTLTIADKTLAADRGRSSTQVTIQLLDQYGKKAKGSAFVTLTQSAGDWVESDLQKETPGFQVRVKQGEAIVHLKSSLYKGVAEIKAHWQNQQVKKQITFVEPQREMIAVGFIDLNGRLNHLSSGKVKPTDQADGFDQSFTVQGETAVFLKGKIKGDLLLTLSYDNKKPDDTGLLSTIDPNAYYPIYGDASIKGYDAQSTSRLYVKLEKSQNSVMWGDFQTDQQQVINNSLSTTRQTLTGLASALSFGRVNFKTFAAEVDRKQYQEEIPGNGTATFYQLEHTPILLGSEQVLVRIRDRDNNGIIIEERLLTINEDYVLDIYSGHLRLFTPLPRYENDNPVSLFIDYQTTEKVDSYLLAGASGEIKLNEQLSLGGAVVHNDDVESGSSLASAHVEFEWDNDHSLIAETAYQHHKDSEKVAAQAHRIELKSQWHDSARTRIHYSQADDTFENSASTVTGGQQELKIDGELDLNENQEIKAQISNSEYADGRSRFLAGVDFKQRFDALQVTVGTHHIVQKNPTEKDQVQTAKLRLGQGFNWFDRAGNLYAEYEQDISNSDRYALALGSELTIKPGVTAFIEHDLLASFSAMTSLDTGQERQITQLGVRADITDTTQGYSTLRMRGAIDEDALNIVNGIRSQFEWIEGLTINPSVEVINQLDGEDQNNEEGYAVSVSVMDTRSKNAKKSLRIENRQTAKADYYAFDMAYAARYSTDWTGLYMNRLNWIEGKAGELDQYDNLFTLGSAYRPKFSSFWQALFFYQWKNEQRVDSKNAHIFSMHHHFNWPNQAKLMSRFAFKHQLQSIDDDNYFSQVFLKGLRFNYPLTDRFELDLRMGYLSTAWNEDHRLSAGFGVYYLLDKNLRLGALYNFIGFDEQDLDSQGYHAQGINFGVQFKFDEDLFRWLK